MSDTETDTQLDTPLSPPKKRDPGSDGEEEEDQQEGQGFFKSLKDRLLPGKSEQEETDSSDPEQ